MEYEKLMGEGSDDVSSEVRQRVEKASEIQRQRFHNTDFTSNSGMGPAEVWDYCRLEESARGLLQAAMKQLDLSARAFHRILKLSLTIADLAGSETIGVAHLAEALQYRPRSPL